MTHAPFLTAAAALAVLVTVVAGALGGSVAPVAVASALALGHLVATSEAAAAFVRCGGVGDDRGARVAAVRLVALQLVGLVVIALLAGSLGIGAVAVGWSIWPLAGLCAAVVEGIRHADARVDAPRSVPTLEATW